MALIRNLPRDIRKFKHIEHLDIFHDFQLCNSKYLFIRACDRYCLSDFYRIKSCIYRYLLEDDMILQTFPAFVCHSKRQCIFVAGRSNGRKVVMAKKSPVGPACLMTSPGHEWPPSLTAGIPVEVVRNRRVGCNPQTV